MGGATPTTEPPRWRFAAFEFNAQTLELRRKGRLVKVRPQSLRLLTLLLERAGELVTRADLHRGLWGQETYVDFDQGVNHCIKELRAALGDAAESPRYIETLARRGYRFIAPVDRVGLTSPDVTSRAETVGAGSTAVAHSPSGGQEETAAPGTGRNVVWFGSVAAALLIAALVATRYIAGSTANAIPSPPALAVAAFVTEPADPALSAGLANAIAQRLGGQHTVAVRGQRDAAATTAADQGIGGARGAALALHGHIVRQGPTVAVRVWLSSLDGNAIVWSEHLRVRADELFSVEDVVAERVVTALGLRLAAEEQDRLRRRYTSNTAAYQDFLRGRAALVRYTPDSTQEAIGAFEQALARDPQYALARAGLAMACADMCLRFASARDVDHWAERAEAAARAALDLDPDLAEAHLARAAVARKREFDWNATINASRRALMLNPNLDQARFFMAAAYYHLGYMEEARIEMEKGRALRGGDIVEPVRIEALIALFGGNFAPALAHLEDVSRLSSQAIGDTYLALAAYYTGNIERGRTMLEALTQHSSTSTATRSAAVLAGVLAAQGQPARAREQLDRVLAGSYRDHHVAYSVGVAHGQLGDWREALRWLRTAADTGFPCLPFFERDPLLEPARRRSEFAELLRHVRERRQSTLSTTY